MEDAALSKNKEGPAPAPMDLTEKLISLRQQLFSEDAHEVLLGSQGIRALVMKDGGSERVAITDIPAKLLSLLSFQNAQIQANVLRTITRMTSEPHAVVKSLMDAGAINCLKPLLRSPLPALVEDSIWSFGNIAGDCDAYRDLTLDARILQELLRIMKRSPTPAVLQVSVWALSNLCRRKPDHEKIAPAIPITSELVRHTTGSIRVDALWTLSYLSDGPDIAQERVAAEVGLVEHIVSILSNPCSLEEIVPALRTAGNLMAGDDATTQLVINANILPALRPLLDHQSATVRKEACWSLSNVLAGHAVQIRSCLDAGVMAPILHNYRNSPVEVQREASWCIANAFAGCSAQDLIMEMMDVPGLVPTLPELLSEATASSFIDLTISAYLRVLKQGENIAVEAGSDINPYIGLLMTPDAVRVIQQSAAMRGRLSRSANDILQQYHLGHHVTPLM